MVIVKIKNIFKKSYLADLVKCYDNVVDLRDEIGNRCGEVVMSDEEKHNGDSLDIVESVIRSTKVEDNKKKRVRRRSIGFGTNVRCKSSKHASNIHEENIYT